MSNSTNQQLLKIFLPKLKFNKKNMLLLMLKFKLKFKFKNIKQINMKIIKIIIIKNQKKKFKKNNYQIQKNL